MEIRRSLQAHGSLLPRAHEVLRRVPTGALHHGAHRVRHPLGLYNNSLTRISAAFADVLDALERWNAIPLAPGERPDEAPNDLYNAQADLLAAMASHLDEGHLILKGLTPPASVTGKGRFVHQQLEASSHAPSIGFGLAAKPYRDSFIPIHNKLKHEGGKLGAVAFFTEAERLLGYFLSAHDAGPDPVLHAGGTALSFPRNLRHHFFQVYALGEALAAAVEGTVARFGSALAEATPSAYDEGPLFAVARRLEGMPRWVFPDEVSQPGTTVQVNGRGRNRCIAVAHPGQDRAASLPAAQVVAFLGGDGATTTGTLPYFGRPTWLPGPS